MFQDEIDCVCADDLAIPLRQSTEFVVEGTIPYVTIEASQEGVDGFLDSVFVVNMLHMMFEGCECLDVLQRLRMARRATKSRAVVRVT
jgi:uncharacterized protein YggL (DUF469 family)